MDEHKMTSFFKLLLALFLPVSSNRAQEALKRPSESFLKGRQGGGSQ